MKTQNVVKIILSWVVNFLRGLFERKSTTGLPETYEVKAQAPKVLFNGKIRRKRFSPAFFGTFRPLKPWAKVKK